MHERTGYGVTYNPSKAALKVVTLNALLTTAQTSLSQVKTSEVAFNNATNGRMNAFKPLKGLGTKIINALDATNASAETVKDARTINRKLQGQRATPKAMPTEPPSATPADKTISVSQQSYDRQIEHFAKLIELLSSDSNYTPNETELKITTLTTTLAALKTANTAVVNSYTTWSNNRIKRNDTLYNPLTGLVAIALDTKKYVKSIFGATSSQFKQVSGIKFTTVK